MKKQKRMAEVWQHETFAELVRDLETASPNTTALGYKGWRLIEVCPSSQDPFKEGGRAIGMKWSRWKKARS
jgi:hypothetical protein